MQIKFPTRRTFLGILAAAPALAADFWKKKPFPGWSENEVRKLLNDSPWATTEKVNFRVDNYTAGPVTYKDIQGPNATIQGGSPVGGIGAPSSKIREEARLVIRWASAKPLRQAAVIQKFGADGVNSDEARRMLEEDIFYVVEILGVPAIVAYRGAQMLQDEILQSSALILKSGRTIRPEAANVKVNGADLNITVRFPKTEPITLNDNYADFVGEGGPFRFGQRFKLKAMIYDGKLEL